jgi:hypothetical protein
MADPKAETAPAAGSTDPAGVTGQAQKDATVPAGSAEKAGSADGGINAAITGAIPGRDPRPELDPADPGINASVVS